MKQLLRKIEPIFYWFRKKGIACRTLWYRVFSKRPIVIAVGDSWFNLTIFDITVPVDTLDWLKRDYTIVDAAVPGYQLSKEIDIKLYEPALKWLSDDQKKVLVLLSLMGNDLLWNHFNRIIVATSNIDARIDREYTRDVILELLADFDMYLAIMRDEFAAQGKKIHVIVNGYDYVHTESKLLFFDGELTPKFEKHGITNEDIANLLMNEIVDMFNDMLSMWADQREMVTYCDLRGTLHGDGDYLGDFHPTPAGYHKLAAKISDCIKMNVSEAYYK